MRAIARTVLYIVAAVAFLVAGAGLAARFLPVTNHAVLFAAALSPYLMAGAGVSALVLLLTRRWLAAAVVLVLAAAAVFVELPLFAESGQVPPNSLPIRVLTANLREGTADPKALVAIARDNVDLLVLEELTPELVNSLTQDGLDSTFPYKVLDARPSANGVGIWSRHPVVRSSRVAGYRLGVVAATIRVPDAAADTAVLAAHLVGPWPQRINGWRNELARLPDTMREMAAGVGPGAAIVAGDFNATVDMEPFRRLLQH